MRDPSKLQFLLIIGLIAVACVARLLPHPPNFSPVAAVALFAGAALASRFWALLVPLAAMALSDLVLGLHMTMPAVYLAMALCVLLGPWLRQGGAWRIAAGAGGGALLFFLVTNLSVWAFTGLYPLSLAGLLQCFTLALPFFQNTLLATLLYSGLLFGAAALLRLELRPAATSAA